MKKSKKIVVYSVVVLLIALLITTILILIGVLPVPSFFKGNNDDNMDSLNNAVEIINDFSTDVILIGDDIAFQCDGLTYRKINTINSDTLFKDSKYNYSYLIINDLNDTVNLTTEEISILSEFICDKNCAMIYLGDKYLSSWDNSQYITNVDGSRSVAYQNEGGNVIRITGLWGSDEDALLTEYPYYLGDTIIYQIEDFIRRNN